MPHPLTASLLVGLGGAAGSLARYGLAILSIHLGIIWPAGTFAANVLGCLIIGVVAELAALSDAFPEDFRLLLATGFCGGFTTLSSLVLEAARMAKADEWGRAVSYLGGTLAAGVLAFALGVAAARQVARAVGAA